MATYWNPMDGDLTLDGIESAIRGEENGAAKFKDCVPVGTPEAASNAVTFEKLPPGTRPKPIVLRKRGQTAPDQAQKIWEGTMIVEKKATLVVAYRET